MAKKKKSLKVRHILCHMINKKLVISYRFSIAKHFLGKLSDLHHVICSWEDFEIQKPVILRFATHSL